MSTISSARPRAARTLLIVPVVTNSIMDAQGRGLREVTVHISLISPLNPFLLNGTGEVLSRVAVDTNETGIWTANLTPNDQLEQTGTYYIVDETEAPGGLKWPIVVPDGPGPYQMRDLLVPLPPDTNPGGPVQIKGIAYEHQQVVASSVWTIHHNLGFKPGGVRIYDSAGNSWFGWDSQDIDVNTLQVDIGVSMGGHAELS
jgi:hypothetical protein